MTMNLARGSICWKDIDGVKQRMCDTDLGPDFQCSGVAAKLLIESDGDVYYACSDRCFAIIREHREHDQIRAVRHLGNTPSGIEIYVVAEPAPCESESTS
jgi:hypothetical protein